MAFLGLVVDLFLYLSAVCKIYVPLRKFLNANKPQFLYL